MSRRFSQGHIQLLLIRKLLAVLLAFSFSFSPLITFAQTVGSDTPPLDAGAGTTSVPGDTSTDTQTQTPPADFSIPGVLRWYLYSSNKHRRGASCWDWNNL